MVTPHVCISVYLPISQRYILGALYTPILLSAVKGQVYIWWVHNRKNNCRPFICVCDRLGLELGTLLHYTCCVDLALLASHACGVNIHAHKMPHVQGYQSVPPALNINNSWLFACSMQSKTCLILWQTLQCMEQRKTRYSLTDALQQASWSMEWVLLSHPIHSYVCMLNSDPIHSQDTYNSPLAPFPSSSCA